MQAKLRVKERGQLYWLPQETILFDRCRLQRRLDVDVHDTSKFLMLEPLVFGRQASDEELRSCFIKDTVNITSGEKPLYLDCVKIDGDISAILQRAAIANGARALASIVLVDPAAKQMLGAVRELLPPTGGASFLADTVLVIRLLAEDSFALRQVLLPILNHLTDDAVPKNWRL
jgi:urease accessory protein